MGVHIKSERVHDLAREAARRTGKSQNSVVEAALRLFLEQIPDDTAPDGASPAAAAARLRSSAPQPPSSTQPSSWTKRRSS